MNKAIKIIDETIERFKDGTAGADTSTDVYIYSRIITELKTIKSLIIESDKSEENTDH